MREGKNLNISNEGAERIGRLLSLVRSSKRSARFTPEGQLLPMFARKPSRDVSLTGADESALDYSVVYPSNKDCDEDEIENPKIQLDCRRASAANWSDDSGESNPDGLRRSSSNETISDDGKKKDLLSSMDFALDQKQKLKEESRKSLKPAIEHVLDYSVTYPSGEGFEGESEIRKTETRKQIIPYDVRCATGSQESTSAGFPKVMTAYKSGLNHEHVQCVVLRDRSNLMYPSYELKLQDTDQTLVVAKKLSMGASSSYHFFDMTQRQTGKVLSKKSENYLGKLRSVNSGRTEYILLSSTSDRLELAGFMYDRQDVLSQLSESSQPRKLFVVLPFLDSSGAPEVNRMTDKNQKVSLAEGLRTNDSSQLDEMHTFGTKIPVLVDGNFRLNFRGRVTVPSVKNFQLVTTDEFNIILQFGKVSDVKFHLDFKAPFNALQAFAVALSQFNG